MSIERVTLPTGRAVYSTGKVLIGIRAGESKPAHAANDDELQIQDIVRGTRREHRVTTAGHRAIPWVCFGCAVLLAVLLVTKS